MLSSEFSKSRQYRLFDPEDRRVQFGLTISLDARIFLLVRGVSSRIGGKEQNNRLDRLREESEELKFTSA